MEPIQNASRWIGPRLSSRSGSRVPNTTPPAKMPTAILETMNVMMETIEST